MNWDRVGWRVRVRFTRLRHQIRPKEHIDLLRGSLPRRYSPLRPNGDGLQSLYLTEVPAIMAELLVQLIGPEASEIVAVAQRANGEISAQVGTEGVFFAACAVSFMAFPYIYLFYGRKQSPSWELPDTVGQCQALPDS